MAIGQAAKELLSALVKYQDRKTLALIQESQFVSDDERKAFRRLRRHVARHDAFPSRATLRVRYKVPVVKTPEPLSYYHDNFIDRAKFNVMRDKASEFMDAMGSRNVEDAERLIEEMALKLREQRVALGGAVRSFDEIAADVFTQYARVQMSDGMLGITTGWPEIDAVTAGYQPGDIVSWIARLGRGKTMMLLYQALKAAQAGHRVLFVSPEVPDIQLVRRMIGMVTGVNPRYLARGRLSTSVYRDVVSTIRGMSLPITFAAGAYKKSIPFIRQMIEELEPEIVFADAMYLIAPEKRRSGSGSRREVISDVAEELKDIATSYDIPIVLSAQFNRTAVKSERNQEGESDRDRKDPLAHLDVHKIGETDVIAQISTLVFVMELGDPPRSTFTRWIGIKKGREGDAGHWLINYLFNPVNFSVISNGTNSIQDSAAEIDEDDLDADLGPENDDSRSGPYPVRTLRRRH